MNIHGSPRARQAGGFSLIELMVAVAIVGILVSIAVPTYREHVRRGAVEEALAELGRGQLVAEQYFLDNHTYSGLDAPGKCPTGTTRFSFSCGNLSGTTYTITATGTAANVSGFKYTVNQAGVHTTDGGDWGTSTSCWIIRKGGTCS